MSSVPLQGREEGDERAHMTMGDALWGANDQRAAS